MKTKRHLKQFCNLIVHSYCFAPNFGDNKLESLYFNSKTDKDKKIYQIELDEVCRVFKTVGEDYPNEVSFKYSEKDKDYIVEAKTERFDIEKFKNIKSLE